MTTTTAIAIVALAVSVATSLALAVDRYDRRRRDRERQAAHERLVADVRAALTALRRVDASDRRLADHALDVATDLQEPYR